MRPPKASPQPPADPTPPAPPKPTVDFSPSVYVEALETLRVDIQHGEFPLGAEQLTELLRCRGWDILGGKIVARALREGMIAPHQLVVVLTDIVERHAKRWDHPDERGKAMLLLATARWVRVHSSEEIGFGMNMLSELVDEHWGSSLVNLARAVLDFFPEAMPDAVDNGNGYSVSLFEHRTREFVRAVYDHAGLEAARAAATKLNTSTAHYFSGDGDKVEDVLARLATWGRAQETER